jgi:hypothetical protein
MSLHVVPLLQASLTNGGAFLAKLGIFWQMLGLLERTMLGTVVAPLAIVGLALLPFGQARSRSLLWIWLAGGLVYVFVVVTYETVDYYMLLLLPLAALLCGITIHAAHVTLVRLVPRYASLAFVAMALALVVGTAAQGIAAVAPYYAYNKQAYRDAIALNATLDPTALVVTAHYGPDVLYYMNRFGWEEDPTLWRPFDQKSAMRKGARYFISIEDRSMRRNAALCDWLQQFPLLQKSGASWPVYVTDLSKRLADPKPCARVANAPSVESTLPPP